MVTSQYIDGQMVAGAGEPFDVVNPATDEVVATLRAAAAAQATLALDAAQRAFRTWSRTSLNERIAWTVKLRDACLAERDTLVDLLAREVGKSYPEAMAECNGLATILDFYAEESKRVYGTALPDYTSRRGAALHLLRKDPVGVAVGHLAWNFPIQNAALKLGPALASGCTCVLKPSSSTPLATLYLGVIGEKIGFPKGVFNILAGPSAIVGTALNASPIPRLVTLIGSSETGRQVMREAATSIKRFSLELGGNAPAVVMPDADLEATAQFMVTRKIRCCGQGCANINRIYVQESIHDPFVGMLRQQVATVKVGWGKDLGEAMGPLINRAARTRVLALINDAVAKGARLLSGGRVPEDLPAGAFLLPTPLGSSPGQHAAPPRGDLRAGAPGVHVPHAGRGDRGGKCHRLRPLLVPVHARCPGHRAGGCRVPVRRGPSQQPAGRKLHPLAAHWDQGERGGVRRLSVGDGSVPLDAAGVHPAVAPTGGALGIEGWRNWCRCCPSCGPQASAATSSARSCERREGPLNNAGDTVSQLLSRLSQGGRGAGGRV